MSSLLSLSNQMQEIANQCNITVLLVTQKTKLDVQINSEWHRLAVDLFTKEKIK